jgi:hypothetical protein
VLVVGDVMLDSNLSSTTAPRPASSLASIHPSPERERRAGRRSRPGLG